MCFGSCVYIAGVVLDSTHDVTDFVSSPSIKKGWCCRHQTDRWHIVLRFESSSVQGIRQKRLDEFLLHCRTPWGKVVSLSILLLTGRINCDATFPHKAVWNSLQGVKWNEIWCIGHYEAWRPRPAQKVRWWLCSRVLEVIDLENDLHVGMDLLCLCIHYLWGISGREYFDWDAIPASFCCENFDSHNQGDPITWMPKQMITSFPSCRW